MEEDNGCCWLLLVAAVRVVLARSLSALGMMSDDLVLLLCDVERAAEKRGAAFLADDAEETSATERHEEEVPTIDPFSRKTHARRTAKDLEK